MGTYFRRNLPHYHLPGATYFITFRLAGSLPLKVAQDLHDTYEIEIHRLKHQLDGVALLNALQEIQDLYFKRLDDLLDKVAYGPRYLAQSDCAHIVMTCIHELAPEYYHLHAFCLMSNHVHLLINQQDIPEPPPRRDGKQYTALSAALLRLKGKSGALCNRNLGRRGAFWQHESYDHVVRNAAEFDRILMYILNNPVKAGLVNDWSEWPYTWVEEDLL